MLALAATLAVAVCALTAVAFAAGEHVSKFAQCVNDDMPAHWPISFGKLV